MKPCLVLLCAILTTGPVLAADLRLPDVLISTNGAKVTSAAMWRNTRRPEILELFRTHVYGRMPVGRPNSLKFEVLESARGVMAGAAARK